MTTIYKYALEVTDEQTVLMPKGSKVLSCAVQNNHLQVWALVDPRAAFVAHSFRIAGTGQAAPVAAVGFIGTVFMASDHLVFHVFDNGEVAS